jgi:hypothetical protein
MPHVRSFPALHGEIKIERSFQKFRRSFLAAEQGEGMSSDDSLLIQHGKGRGGGAIDQYGPSPVAVFTFGEGEINQRTDIPGGNCDPHGRRSMNPSMPRT